jgi:hypothetical protein
VERVQPHQSTYLLRAAGACWAVLACSVGKLNPRLRHAEQLGFVLDRLDFIRQAEARFGVSPELIISHFKSPDL